MLITLPILPADFPIFLSGIVWIWCISGAERGGGLRVFGRGRGGVALVSRRI